MRPGRWADTHTGTKTPYHVLYFEVRTSSMGRVAGSGFCWGANLPDSPLNQWGSDKSREKSHGGRQGGGGGCHKGSVSVPVTHWLSVQKEIGDIGCPQPVGKSIFGRCRRGQLSIYSQLHGGNFGLYRKHAQTQAGTETFPCMYANTPGTRSTQAYMYTGRQANQSWPSCNSGTAQHGMRNPFVPENETHRQIQHAKKDGNNARCCLHMGVGCANA